MFPSRSFHLHTSFRDAFQVCCPIHRCVSLCVCVVVVAAPSAGVCLCVCVLSLLLPHPQVCVFVCMCCRCCCPNHRFVSLCVCVVIVAVPSTGVCFCVYVLLLVRTGVSTSLISLVAVCQSCRLLSVYAYHFSRHFPCR